MKRAHVVAGVAAILLAVASFTYIAFRPTGDNVPTRDVQLAGETLHVFVADTESLREKGLGGRAGLPSDQGMLFVFTKDGTYGFWMKDMRFPIDILWLSSEGTVVHMAQGVSPDTYPQNFTSDKPARYVLELPAGWAVAHTVQIGDIVRL